MSFSVSKFAAVQEKKLFLKDDQGNDIADDAGNKPYIVVFPKGSAKYAKAIADQQNRAIKNNFKARNADDLQAAGTQLLAACCGETNLTMDDGSPIDSREKWAVLLADPANVIIREQVDAAIGTAEMAVRDFLS